MDGRKIGRPKKDLKNVNQNIVPVEEAIEVLSRLNILPDLIRMRGIDNVNSYVNQLYTSEIDRVVYLFIIKGWNYPIITDFLVSNKLAKDKKSAKKIIERVRDDMYNLSAQDGEKMRGVVVERYNDLYQKLYENGDYEKCANVLEKMSKVYNLLKERIELDIQTYKINFEG